MSASDDARLAAAARLDAVLRPLIARVDKEVVAP